MKQYCYRLSLILSIFILVSCNNQAVIRGESSVDITICLFNPQQKPLKNQEFKMTLILDDGQILTSHTTQADAHGCKGYSIGEFTSTYPQPFKVQVNVFYKGKDNFVEYRPNEPKTIINIEVKE
ncbi:MAG TPA: hypothetical protein DEF47_14000 [Herpetosiphon sp.]|uniref:hypothetical protein n=1 Tax=Herpetosiphon sp. TaxID=71864 RepID=UPI00059E6BB5|nr:hypothetical protein [Herpetosiphon sp.]HBW51002.1 hypothetical protein [Herpetosiphon sp.]